MKTDSPPLAPADPQSSTGPSLHLVKLSVGSESIESMQRWQAGLRLRIGDVRHVTRMTPRRGQEILDGEGSIYWVIKGRILCRQRIWDLVPVTDETGASACAIILDPEIHPTERWTHRPFQGWRYLDPAKAPPDIAAGGEASPDMPEAMAEELRKLGFL
ncbi:MAG: DUF1489 family protein [Rhodospirillaceae bacterium]